MGIIQAISNLCYFLHEKNQQNLLIISPSVLDFLCNCLLLCLSIIGAVMSQVFHISCIASLSL